MTYITVPAVCPFFLCPPCLPNPRATEIYDHHACRLVRGREHYIIRMDVVVIDAAGVKTGNCLHQWSIQLW